MKILIGLLFVAWVLCRWILPGSVFISYLRNPEITDYFEHGFIIVLVGWGLIWLPFQRVEKLVDEHKKALADATGPLRDRITEHEERDRLKLTVECNESISGCHTMVSGASHHFFRLAVVLDWNQPATGCFGKLMKIEKDGRVIRDHDVEELPYARSHEPDALNKSLNPRVREFLDVLVVAVHSTPQKVFAPSTAGREITLTTQAGNDVFSEPGEYRLTVALCGKNIPTQIHELSFNWAGESTRSSLTLIA
jgi:hypothetical protein